MKATNLFIITSFFASFLFASRSSSAKRARTTESSVPTQEAEVDEGLVKVEEKEGLRLNLVYATKNNFVKQKVYNHALCFIHQDAFEKLEKAVELVKKQGLGIKIFDAFRPQAAQRKFWEIMPDPQYVADPKTGSHHNRGIAVDVTLYNLQTGEDLDMGTEFDAFEEKSHHVWTTHNECPQDVKHNRETLTSIMTEAGFAILPTEWWHYELKNTQRYPLIKNSYGIMEEHL